MPLGLSKRKGLKPSATAAVTALALDLQRQGQDVISMAAGEPDFATPAHIREAAKRALDEGKTKYTPVAGIAELREAVAAKFNRENALQCDPGQVVVSSGAKQSLYNAFQALLEPGDEVLLPAPYWVSYPAQIELSGGVPVEVPTSARDGFRLDPAEVRRRVTPRTKVLLVNSPNNPTGAAYPAGTIRELAGLALEHDFWIISDEIYEHLSYGGEVALSPGTIAPEHTVTINGASKAYAMTGWRLGYSMAPLELTRRMIAVQGQVSSNASSISQWAAVAALNGPQDFLPGFREAYRRRRDLITDGLNRLGMETPRPDGAFYVLADTTPIHADEGEAARILLEKARVAAVPGTDFAAPGRTRFSYACADEQVERVLERLAGLGRD